MSGKDAQRAPQAPAPVVNVYAGSTHDRAASLRSDPQAMQGLLDSPSARFLPFWRGQPLIGGARLVHLTRADVPDMPNRETVFLGNTAEATLFAVDLSADETAPTLSGGEFAEIRPLILELPSHEAGLIAHARGMLHWRRTHRFCGQCGAPYRGDEGGQKLICTANPAHLNFPRTDPVVIMLVTHGDSVFLARGVRFPPEKRTLSALAGFVEPGESAEDAVAREVLEESGLVVRNVRYHSSQPWPFPGSLMLGFTAEAESRDFTLDPGEIVEGRWLTRADIRAIDGSEFTIPGHAAIARRLIDDWLAAE